MFIRVLNTPLYIKHAYNIWVDETITMQSIQEYGILIIQYSPIHELACNVQ